MPIQGEMDANENKKNPGGPKALDANQNPDKDSAGPGRNSQAGEQGPQDRPLGPASGPASGAPRRPPGAGKEEIDSSAPSATNPGTGSRNPEEVGGSIKKGPNAERQGPGDANRRDSAATSGNGRPASTDTGRRSAEQARPSTISSSERNDTDQQRPQHPEIEEEPNWFVKTYRKIRDSIYSFCCQTEDNIRHVA